MAVTAKKIGAFRMKKAVTLPVMKMTVGAQRFFTFDGPMHVGKDTGQVMNGKKMEPATIANVSDLETGECGVLICATVFQKEIQEGYPGESYVGLSFAVTMFKVPEKKYNLYEIFEIEPDEAEVTTEKVTTPTAEETALAEAAQAVADAGKSSKAKR